MSFYYCSLGIVKFYKFLEVILLYTFVRLSSSFIARKLFKYHKIINPINFFFFLIDNKSFIDERNNVFTIINTLPLKQIQSNHKERLIEIWDHSNKVLASKVFNLSIGLSTSSKVRALRSFHTNHIRQAGTKFQTFEE